MPEQYSKVCKKIIEYYKEYLTNQEILALTKILRINNYDNLNIIIFINKLIDRIWVKTLTTPTSYKEGENFTFLTTRDILPNIYYTDNISKTTNLVTHLELITDKNITTKTIGLSGLIVDIDYLNSFSEPLLPIDFKENKIICAKTHLNINGTYNISLGIGSFDPDEELVSYFSDIHKIHHLKINKPIYNYLKNSQILDTLDKDVLADFILISYLYKYKFKDIVKVREELKKQYKVIIISKYKEFFNKQITLDDLIDYIFNLLDKNPILQDNKVSVKN